MGREAEIGRCESCSKNFGYYLIHNGFNDSAYAYCDRCGEVCLLDLSRLPKGVQIKEYGVIPAEVEPLLLTCRCEGSFKAGSSPRCTHCLSPLSSDKATKYIEANAPGTSAGFRWQRNWEGIYCIVIEDRVSHACWREESE